MAFTRIQSSTLALCLLLLLGAGCAQLSDEMFMAETAYEQARYEESDVWLEDLERDVADMGVDMRARFYFLRGMTEYRLGRRNGALHYLALARETAGEEGRGSLREDWVAQMDRTLLELTPNTASFRAREQGVPAAAVEPAQAPPSEAEPSEDPQDPQEGLAPTTDDSTAL